MKGCRALSDGEIEDVLGVLKTKRDICLFLLGLRTGLRISELLSLKISDVVKHGQIASRIEVARCHTKGKSESKNMVLESDARKAIETYLNSIPGYSLEDPLFKSKKSGAITRVQAH